MNSSAIPAVIVTGIVIAGLAITIKVQEKQIDKISRIAAERLQMTKILTRELQEQLKRHHDDISEQALVDLEAWTLFRNNGMA